MAELKQDGIPLYHQLKELFIEKIVNGEWTPGTIIPNEIELSQQYKVSRGPVRAALMQLVREGLLTRKQGKGTWVLPPKIETGLGRFYSFTTLIEQKGLQHKASLLSFDTVTSKASVARILRIPEGESLYMIYRLRLADDEPLILERVYVPVGICKGLTQQSVATVSLYALLSRHCGVSLVKMKQFFEPVVVDKYEAKVLQIPVGAPALLVQNITYTDDDRPVVLSKSIMRGDRVRYYVELSTPVDSPFLA